MEILFPTTPHPLTRFLLIYPNTTLLPSKHLFLPLKLMHSFNLRSSFTLLFCLFIACFTEWRSSRIHPWELSDLLWKRFIYFPFLLDYLPNFLIPPFATLSSFAFYIHVLHDLWLTLWNASILHPYNQFISFPWFSTLSVSCLGISNEASIYLILLLWSPPLSGSWSAFFHLSYSTTYPTF